MNRKLLRWVFAALLGLVGSGCARTMQFSVARPAIINLSPWNHRIGIADIQANGRPEAAQDISELIRSQLRSSLNSRIQLLTFGGDVVIEGRVAFDAFERRMETVSQTCTRTVDDGPDNEGNQRSHTESYDCSYAIEVGLGTSSVLLRVVQSGEVPRVLFEKLYRASRSVSSPSASDELQTMHQVRADNVAEFAKVILPWREIVSERFEKCDGDDRCARGFDAARRGNLVDAQALFSEVIGPFSAGFIPGDKLEQVGEAYYNRGLVRAYLGRFEDAKADLSRAILLCPDETKWPLALARVERLREDDVELRAQGAR